MTARYVALLFGGMLLTFIVAAVSMVSPASATASSAAWSIDTSASPTEFSSSQNSTCLNLVAKGLLRGAAPPECDAIIVTARNAGADPTDGSAVTLADALPNGLTVRQISFFWSGAGRSVSSGGLGLEENTDLNLQFPGEGRPAPCSLETLTCTLPFQIAPDDTLKMVIYVTVNEPSAVGPLASDTATVSGGGADEASTTLQDEVGVPLPFGLAGWSAASLEANGGVDSQAGDHPYEFTARIVPNSVFRNAPEGGFYATSVQDIRDIAVDLPLGFLGGALAAPTCTLSQLASALSCPPDTRIGRVISEPVTLDSVNSNIYNMVPEKGVAAEFGFRDALDAPHLLYGSVVPTPSGYVLRTTSREIPQIALTAVHLTFFGDPNTKNASGNPPQAMFTNPASCSGHPLVTTIHMDSWQNPGTYNADGTPNLGDPNWVPAASQAPAVTGCNRLHFDATLSAQPDTSVADSPAGLNVDVTVPQTESPSTLATPPLRTAVVTLPPGFTVDPSAAEGLGACSPAEIALESAAPPTCPASSQIGTVELTTPLIAGTLKGSIYLATQNENPFDSLLAGYIVVNDPVTGVVVKIPGDLTPNPVTGQIRGVFENNPQFPFSDLKLRFTGGPRGDLATPEDCGRFQTTSSFTPWSAPDSGPPATPSDSFEVNSGCVNGFAPTLTASSTNTQAGSYSPVVLSFSRTDTDQGLSGLSLSLPSGLLAKVAGVPQCSDPDATAGDCPEASQVGTVQAGAGPGPDPLFLPGKAYLTGPYKGAPYGLAVVVPAIAGPFNLGTVVVRQALHINPVTGQVTAVSDPFPTILQGIPIRLRRVDVSINRAAFTFNPTSCNPTTITGNFNSTEGATATVSSRFQVGGCGELPFKPSFAVATHGPGTKANGASLDVKVMAPGQGPHPDPALRSEANIHKVDVQLPLALPSRLSTLQKACTEAQFAANPAGCPPASVVGTAVAHTPLLTDPLAGPAYLVSHGGAAFPDLVLVLQGDNVTIELTGQTQIKKGITYSKFESIPDAPIESFELKLPEGRFSVLAANGNLCARTKTIVTHKRETKQSHGHTVHVLRTLRQTVATPLLMPTTITAQSGTVFTQTTKIAITGCTKKTKATKHKKSRTQRKKG